MWRFVRALLGALVMVLWRRLRRHPVYHEWPFSFEMLVETMRRFSRSVAELSPVELRTAMARLPVALEKGVKVSSEDGATRFTPDGATKVILYLHGGGYVFGSAMADGALVSSLASRAHRIVVALDYRLAPEHPCPAALDDARTAYQNLLDRAVAPEDIVIAGLSSGGGLALALAARCRTSRTLRGP